MAREKVSMTVDPVKVAIVEELERRHIAGYLAHPPRADEDAWAEVERDPNEIADDVDWARLYGVSRSR